MSSIKRNHGASRLGVTLLCTTLLLAGCGLASSHGSVDAGAKYQASGEYRAAYIEAKKVLQRDNKDGAAWLLLGQSSLMLGDPKDALSNLQNARANGVPTARWAVPMGRALLVTRQYDKLLATLDTSLALPPEIKTQTTALRGDAYRELNQPDQARPAYQAALAIDPKNPRALIGLATLAATDHDNAAADKYVQQALAASPDNPQAWVAKADLAFNRADFAGAETAYQKVLDFKHADWLPQERFYALSRLANAQAQQGELDKALANIQTLEKMSPQQPYPRYLHAVVLYKQGHLDDAIGKLQEVLKLAPDNTQAQLLMGTVNYAQGNYGQAEMYLSNAMGMDQKNADVRKLLALTLYREGRSRQALDTLRPAAPADTSDAQLLALLQRAVATDVGSPATAASAAAHAAALPPTDTRFADVNQALADGKTAKAIGLLKAMPAGDTATETQRNALLVVAYTRDKRPDEAVKSAAAYVAKNPQSSAAHLLYGTALIAADKRTQARAQYTQALQLDPENPGALMSLGSLDSLEGHYQDAANRYDTVLKADPRNTAALMARARLATLLGDSSGAIKRYQQAIDAAPKSPAAYIALIMLHSESGQFDAAVATARQLATAAPDNPAALNALGAAELNAGHHKEALRPLHSAVKLAPQVALYRINLARAQLVDKDTQGAAANLDQVLKADPTQATAVALRASMKLQEHDLPGAIALARTLQKQPASAADGFALEGDLYMANKSYREAAQAYGQGLKLSDARPLVFKHFQALSASGAKQPERLLLDWLTKHPDDAAARMLLADSYMTHTQNALAAEQYERVLKAHPSNINALNNLAWIYTGQNNPKALTLAEQAYKLAPQSPGIADTYAWALIAANHSATALPILQQAAKAAPEAPVIQYHLAVAQARTGDHAAGRSTLGTLLKTGADFADKAAAEKLYHEIGGTTDTGK